MSEEDSSLIPLKKDYDLLLFKCKMKSEESKADHPLKKRRVGGDQEEGQFLSEKSQDSDQKG